MRIGTLVPSQAKKKKKEALWGGVRYPENFAREIDQNSRRIDKGVIEGSD